MGDTLRRHVEQRLGAAINKYFDRAIEAQVQFSREGHQIRTYISVHAGSGILLQSHAASEDIRSSFDHAADRVLKRLRRYKRRLINHHLAQRPASEAEQITARQVVLAAGDDDLMDEVPIDAAPVTVAETTTSIHTLTVSEAVMRLDLAELPVLMFHNSAHGGLNVVYRRDDGNIGWIDPHHLKQNG